MASEPNWTDAPPTEPGELLLPGDAPRWPRVVGIISIVWGSLGLLCAGCGIVYFGVMMPRFSQMAEEQMGGPMPAVMMPPLGQYVMMALGTVLAVVLVVAGSLTAARNPLGRVLHLAYGAVGVLLSLVGSAIGVQQQLAIAEYFRQNPTDPWAKQNNPTVGFVMVAVMALLGLAWPGFCLIWFGLVKRTAESLTGGAPAPAA